VTGGKPIAVLLQSISGVSVINPLVAFYDIHGRKREVLLFYFVPDTTRNSMTYIQNKHRFRGFKLTIAGWLKFSLIEKFTYELDV
jgi:hypothetical protein